MCQFQVYIIDMKCTLHFNLHIDLIVTTLWHVATCLLPVPINRLVINLFITVILGNNTHTPNTFAHNRPKNIRDAYFVVKVT